MSTAKNKIFHYAKVGIGTESPQKQLQILGDSDTCLRITSSSNGVASLQLGDVDDTVKGAITFLNSDHSLRIRGHNNTDRMVITSAGDLEPGDNLTYQCGTNSKRWSVVNTNVLSASSYAAVGSIVASDPGSDYYSYNNRIGSGLAVVGNSRFFNYLGIGDTTNNARLIVRGNSDSGDNDK